MGNSELDLELLALLKSLSNACELLYDSYGTEIKFVGLVVIAFLSFQLGKKTVVDPLEEEVREMRHIMETRDHYTIVIPQKIKSLGRKTKVIFILLAIGTIAYFTLQQLQPKLMEKIDVNIFILVATLFLVCGIAVWLYQLLLEFKLKRGKFNDHQVIEKIGNIVKMLGSKAQLLLQYFLCKDSYNKYKGRSTEGCSKEKCQEYRKLLDEKLRGVSVLLHNVINFQWCLACKKRQPFDEYLDFQVTEYVLTSTATEEEEVNNKNNYLLKEIEKMTKWVKDIGPCNCSMRYWYDSKKEISQFKLREKEIEPKIIAYEDRKK